MQCEIHSISKKTKLPTNSLMINLIYCSALGIKEIIAILETTDNLFEMQRVQLSESYMSKKSSIGYCIKIESLNRRVTSK